MSKSKKKKPSTYQKSKVNNAQEDYYPTQGNDNWDGDGIFDNSTNQFQADNDQMVWQNFAGQVYNTIIKHPYVDVTNPKKVIANFFVSSHQDDMNLNILASSVDHGLIVSAEEFFLKLVAIFQKVVDADFDPLVMSDYTRRLVLRCKHLVQYSKWVCYETLPMISDVTTAVTTDTTKSSLSQKNKSAAVAAIDNSSLLKESIRQQARIDREHFLEMTFSPSSSSSNSNNNTIVYVIEAGGINLCRKLLKDLERSKNKTEKYQISYFQLPVDDKLLADYSVYVRKPIDLATIKNKLEKTSSSSSSSSTSSSALSGYIKTTSAFDVSLIPRYNNYFEFISDCRRIFSNAIKYNAAHIASDTTGLSQLVYDAAVYLQQKLESLLHMFSITLIDRIETMRHEWLDLDHKESIAKEVTETVEKSVQEFQAQTQAALVATDRAYAHDLDTLAKRKDLRLQMQLSSLGLGLGQQQQQKGSGGSSGGVLSQEDEESNMNQLLEAELLLKGFGMADGSIEGQQLSLLQAKQQQQAQQLLLLPVGMSRRFAKLWPLKQMVRNNARQYFQERCGRKSTVVAVAVTSSSSSLSSANNNSNNEIQVNSNIIDIDSAATSGSSQLKHADPSTSVTASSSAMNVESSLPLTSDTTDKKAVSTQWLDVESVSATTHVTAATVKFDLKRNREMQQKSALKKIKVLNSIFDPQ